MSEVKMSFQSTETLIAYALDTLDEKRKNRPDDVYLQWFTIVFSILRQLDKQSREASNAKVDEYAATSDNPTNIPVTAMIKSLSGMNGLSSHFISYKDLIIGIAWLITTIIALAALFQ